MSKHGVLLLFFICAYIGLSTLLPAQEEEKTPAQAREIYDEVKKLREKSEKYLAELAALQDEFIEATPERQKEIESEGLLKQRSMDRVVSVTMEKEKTLFDLCTALIQKDSESVELRKMRYETAFVLQEYETVLEDIKYLPKDNADGDFCMVVGESLENLYRFKEAIPYFEQAIKLFPKEKHPYPRAKRPCATLMPTCLIRLSNVIPSWQKKPLRARGCSYKVMPRLQASMSRYGRRNRPEERKRLKRIQIHGCCLSLPRVK
jgi:tetratricopeptide (TPR) repeat protein